MFFSSNYSVLYSFDNNDEMAKSIIFLFAYYLIDKQMVSLKIPLSKVEVGQAFLETIFPKGNENIPLQMVMNITENSSSNSE